MRTSCAAARFGKRESRRRDSNPRPFAYKANALPAELLRPDAGNRRREPSCPKRTWPSRCLRHARNMGHPKTIGDRTTLAVMLALRQVGYALLVPFGENTRYDLVIDDGRTLSRVQCKTGRLRHGAIDFKVCSSYAHHPNPKPTKRDYVGQVDYFGVHCPQTGGVYLVPIQDAASRTRCSLRVAPSRNNQSRRIRLAAPYEIANFGPQLPTAGPRASSGARGSSA
jgi:hypothetical protein